MSDRRLIFHIGHHKTGSTSIQNALARGDITLPGRRILYSTRMAHNYLRQHFDAWADRGATLAGSPGFLGLDQIAALLAAGDYDDAVFSGEEFEDIAPAHFRGVLERFFLPHVQEHRILCWVRPHAARTLSSFAEQTKIGVFGGDPDSFHRRAAKVGRFRYDARLTPWTRSFGAAFIARPMVRDVMAQGSAVHDFAAQAFGPAAQVAASGDTANESLCLEDLVILRHLQGRIQDRDRSLRHAFGWEMARMLGAHPRPGGATRLALHKSLAERIHADYRRDARALDKTLFAATPVMLRELERAVDTALPAPQSLEPADHFSADELRWLDLLADTVLMSLGNAPETWQAYLRGRRVALLQSLNGRGKAGAKGGRKAADRPGAKAAAPAPAAKPAAPAAKPAIRPAAQARLADYRPLRAGPAPAGPGSYAIVCTMRGTPEQVAPFVAHHLEGPATGIHLYLDAADPVLEALFAPLAPRLKVTVCDAAYWAAQDGKGKGRRPDGIVRRQTANAEHARRQTDADWLVHIDSDEFLVPAHPGAPDLRAELAALPAGIAWVRLAPHERVFPTAAGAPQTIFDGAFRSRLPDADLVAQVYGDSDGFLSSGLSGHTRGKTAIRVDHPVRSRLHDAVWPWQEGSKPAEADLPPFVVSQAARMLHFDGWTALQWTAKLLNRIDGGKGDSGHPGRRRQLAFMADARDAGARMDLFRRIMQLDDRQAALLAGAGALDTTPFDPRPAVARVFPGRAFGFDVAGFDAALRRADPGFFTRHDL